ncbi:MAG TPA: thioesterase family protein [Nocardioides sp.]|uniref:acyl-CoA thioesterase n=1 Tax=Nocardioides sp. TaxID=35761 RepID=UPI002F407E58
MRHVYECQMRRADLHGEHISNVAVIDYLQEARLDLLRHHGTSPIPRHGEGLVVVNTVVDYVAPLGLAQAPLHVAVWATQVRAASFTLGYELSTGSNDARVVHARATTVLSPYVFAAGHPRRMTTEERERLSGHLDPSPVSERTAPRGPEEWAPGFLERPISVRFSDVDLLGHVNNLRYLDYAEMAQVDLMTGVFREARVNGSVRTVIVRSETDYVGQMNLRPEPYAVRSRVVGVGRHSASLEQEIRDGYRVMARSRIVEVNVDDDDRPLEWHPKHRELFEQRMRDAAVS